MTDESQKPDYTIPTYSRGTWTDRPFPISGYWDDPLGDHDEIVRKGGYVQFLRQTGHGLDLNVWRWEGLGEGASPRQPHPDGGALYLIDIMADGYQTVAAVDVVDMMDVLARWAPTLQADILARWRTQSNEG